MTEYICKNNHRSNYPNVIFEAKENEDTKEFEGNILCEECGEKIGIDGENLQKIKNTI